VTFGARKFPTGEIVNFGPSGGTVYTTAGARDNCVVHQEGRCRITARPGKYRIEAAYRPGNAPLGLVGGPVVDLEVLPGPSGVGSANSAAGDATTAPEDTRLRGLAATA